jgi:hypothetical protein
MKKKKILIWVGIGVAIIALLFIFRSKKPKDAQIYAEVKKGNFEIVVSVTGELEALNKENIVAPQELRSDYVRIYQVKIQDLIPEGTVVDSGDYVATLDKTEITTRLNEALDDLERQQSNFTKAQIDTTIQLRGLRDDIRNLQFDLEERQIALEQSQFEPPATIRQAQINVDKAKRALDNVTKNYVLKVRQLEANMADAQLNLKRPQRRISEIEKVMTKFIINAPKKGMVIYAKEWTGDKRKVGTTFGLWDPRVATLPDLSIMISKTYVSEVDINQIKANQMVRLGVDAFPDKKYSGKVIKVSNVGEQLQGSDSKVFEVIVQINGTDPVLRPYMTTSNTILINTFKDVTYIPIEAVHSEDSIPFVYKKDGTKQIVLLGDMNQNDVIVEKGLKQGDVLYLAVPDKADKFPRKGEELIAQVKAKEAKKKKDKEEFERKQKEQEEAAKRNPEMAGNTSDQGSQNSKSQNTKSSGGSSLGKVSRRSSSKN